MVCGNSSRILKAGYGLALHSTTKSAISYLLKPRKQRNDSDSHRHRRIASLKWAILRGRSLRRARLISWEPREHKPLFTVPLFDALYSRTPEAPGLHANPLGQEVN